ncbi:MAG: hypothetical protein ABIC95_04670 [archaeon]
MMGSNRHTRILGIAIYILLAGTLLALPAAAQDMPYAAEGQVQFHYDDDFACPLHMYSMGRPCMITDPAATTYLEYDMRGHLSRHIKLVNYKNRLPDGGFDVQERAIWRVMDPETVFVNEDCVQGPSCVKLTAPQPYGGNPTYNDIMSRHIPANRQQKHTVSFSAKRLSGTGNLALKILYYNDSAEAVIDTKHYFINVNESWVRYSQEISKDFPSGTKHIIVQFFLSSHSAQEVMLDAAQLEVGSNATRFVRNGYAVSYQYDKGGRLTRLDDPDNRHTHYTYNLLDQTTGISIDLDGDGTVDIQDAVSVDYNPSNAYSSLTLGSVVAATFGLSPRNYLESIDSSTLKETYTYGPAGNLLSITEALSGASAGFAYDDLNRLTDVDDKGYYLPVPDPSGGAYDVSFAYDKAGNRISRDDIQFTIEPGTNRLLQDGYFTYTYDDAGNLQTRNSLDPNAGTYVYGYDALNRLISVSYVPFDQESAAGYDIRYLYDYTSSRIIKESIRETSLVDITLNTYDQASNLIYQEQYRMCDADQYVNLSGIRSPECCVGALHAEYDNDSVNVPPQAWVHVGLDPTDLDTYLCCGDDAFEYPAIYRDWDPADTHVCFAPNNNCGGTTYTNPTDSACCEEDRSCVMNATCYPRLAMLDIQDALPDDSDESADFEFCVGFINYSAWMDADVGDSNRDGNPYCETYWGKDWVSPEDGWRCEPADRWGDGGLDYCDDTASGTVGPGGNRLLNTPGNGMRGVTAQATAPSGNGNTYDNGDNGLRGPTGEGITQNYCCGDDPKEFFVCADEENADDCACCDNPDDVVNQGECADARYPFTPSVNVTGTEIWSYEGYYGVQESMPDFTDLVNGYLEGCREGTIDCDCHAGNCLVPVDFISDGGVLAGDNVQIRYVLNGPPVCHFPDFYVDEGELLTIRAMDFISDPDDPVLSYEADLPSVLQNRGASFDGEVLTWQTEVGDYGVYQVIFSAEDDGNPPPQLSCSQEVNIYVGYTNRAPTIYVDSPHTIKEGQLLTFEVSGTDPDFDPLTFSSDYSINVEGYGALPRRDLFNPDALRFSWQTGFSDVGKYAIEFEVTDVKGLSDTKIVLITVLENGDNLCENADYDYLFPTNMFVYGEGCHDPGKIMDMDTFGVGDAGTYRLVAKSYRPAGSAEPNQAFTLEVNDKESAVSEDDADPATVSIRYEDFGSFSFVPRSNDVYMHTASTCENLGSSGEVHVEEICLFEDFFCGNNYLDPGEECEPKESRNNDYCPQDNSTCQGVFTATRDQYGDCSETCGCEEDDYDFACVADNCGAACAVDADCDDLDPLTDDSCSLTTCSCDNVYVPVCDNGVVDYSEGEECEYPGTPENQYCPQDPEECDAAKLGTRPAYGNCDATCGCQLTDYDYACVVGSCGATCAGDGDCDDLDPNTNDACILETCSCDHVYVPQCDNGVVDFDEGEECEYPGTALNQYCPQPSEDCDGPKYGARDGYGDCDATCGCQETDYDYACVKDQCGAACAVDEDCADVDPNTNDICDLSVCSCKHVYQPRCGNSIVDTGEDCDDGKNGDPTDQCSDACRFTKCGDGTMQSPNGEGLGGPPTPNNPFGTGYEQCDDGNNIDDDGCSALCVKETLPFRTCQGEGDLYFYQRQNPPNPFIPAATTFKVWYDQLVVFSRKDTVFTKVQLDGVDVPITCPKSFEDSFGVKVCAIDTYRGAEVSVDASLSWSGMDLGARAIQGFLAQNKDNPAYNIDNMDIVHDGHKTNEMYLIPDTYDFVFFDKYTINRPGQGIDYREMTVEITDPEGHVIFDEEYDQPYPDDIDGSVLITFDADIAGMYELETTTEDSNYWLWADCPRPDEVFCGDGVRDAGEECDEGFDNGVPCTPSYEGSCTYCSDECAVATVGGGYCGNGVTEGQEECDLAQYNGLVCSAGYGETCEYCEDDCTDVTITGPHCGDGWIQDEEECDDGGVANGDGCSSICLFENMAPVVTAFSSNVQSGFAPLTAMFSCTATGGEGPLVFTISYSDGTAGDEFLDKAPGQSVSATHIFTDVGDHTAVCMVADTDGDNAVSALDIEVIVFNGPATQAADLTVAGDGCSESIPATAGMSISVPSSGAYKVYGLVDRGGCASSAQAQLTAQTGHADWWNYHSTGCGRTYANMAEYFADTFTCPLVEHNSMYCEEEANEDFFVEIGGTRGPISGDDDHDALLVTSGWEYLGSFQLSAGSHQLSLKSATECEQTMCDKVCVAEEGCYGPTNCGEEGPGSVTVSGFAVYPVGN